MARRNQRDGSYEPLDRERLYDEALEWRDVFDQESELHAEFQILSKDEHRWVWNEERRRERGTSSD